MGREIRMVPQDWKHPKNEQGHYIPLFGRSFAIARDRYAEELQKWNEGFRQDFSNDGEWVPREGQELALSFDQWNGKPPQECDYMPDWPANDRTHFMMYEDTTEGTPISPAMATPEALARWLADNGASAFGYMTATYDQWLDTIGRGHACGLLISGGVMQSGVAASTPKATNP